MRQANVLIVDDDPAVRLDLRNLVATAGHSVVGEADSGGQAVALARVIKPDVVLLDADLPGVAGMDVVKTLAGDRIAPVVLYGGSASPESIAQACTAGATSLLSLPLRCADLGPALAFAVVRHAELIALEEEIRSLNFRMEARRLVGRAKAILMEKQGLAEREAFRRIQSQSTALGKPVHEIAQAIITASEISA